MSEKSGAHLNIEIAQRLQERFETYWLGLIFTLLAASIHTAKFGFSPIADIFELLAWFFLLIAGLAGLSRFEWIPEIYRLRSLQVEKEEYARAVQKAMLQGTQEVYVAPLHKAIPAKQYAEESEASARMLEEKVIPVERRQQIKYRVKKWTFVAAICFLIAARSYAPIFGILESLRR